MLLKTTVHALLIAAFATGLSACGGGGSGSDPAAGTASGNSSSSSSGASSSGSSSSGASSSSSGASSSSSGASSSSSSSSGVTTASTDVLTYHNDLMRTGQYLTETVLTPANVTSSSFGLLQQLAADGVVDATPLVVSNLSIGGVLHNVVYVATENDSVYAYDLNSFAQLAKVSLLATGETPASTVAPCNQVSPTIGITSTPVIDRSAGPNGTIFVVAMSQDASGTTVDRLHALDLTTLADRVPAVAIQATYPGSSGTTTFASRQYKERSALQLYGGQIYTAWASNCDYTPYNSWIMAYNESLVQTQVINLTPNGSAGAIWNTGGVLVDSAGSLYALLGNGTYDANQDYGNAMVRLTTTGTALSVVDNFTPLNTAMESTDDIDFGSGSPMIIPDQTDSAGSVHQLVFGGGKDGDLYLLNRANLGGFNASANQVFQELSGALGHGLFSAPAYYNGSIYVGGVNEPLYAFTLANAMMPTSPSSQSGATFGYPGTSPSVSANGTTNGIVWAVAGASPAVLHAYNPVNLAAEYYNSSQAANGRDAFGNGNKFVTPVIANGKVLVATGNGVAVFGLL